MWRLYKLFAPCISNDSTSSDASRRLPRNLNKRENITARKMKINNNKLGFASVTKCGSDVDSECESYSKEAVDAIIKDIDENQETNIPSFQWRFRLGFGTLPHNKIGGKGVLRIAEALIGKVEKYNEELVELDNNSNSNSNSQLSFRAGDRDSLPRSDLISGRNMSLPFVITSIDLRGQGIGNKGAAGVGKLLQADTYGILKVLILSQNDITDEGVCSIATGLANGNFGLEKLIMCDNEIGSRGVVALFNAIRAQQQASRVIRKNSRQRVITSVNGRTVPDTGSSGIVHLEIGFSRVVPKGEKHNAHVEGGDGSEKEMFTTLNSPQQTNLLSDDACMIIRDVCFSPSSPLQSLKIGNCHTCLSASALGAILRGVGTMGPRAPLKELSLQDCLSEDSLTNNMNGIRALMEPLAASVLKAPRASSMRSNSGGDVEGSPVLSLELSDLPLGDVGVRILADALARPGCQLNTLGLHRCKMTLPAVGVISGYDAIGRMLVTNDSLVKLDISCSYDTALCDDYMGNSHNNVGETGAELVTKSGRPSLLHSICEAMRENRTLEHLILSELPFSDSDAVLLCNCLSHSRTPNMVLSTVRHRPLTSDKLMTRLDNLLTRNTNLKVGTNIHKSDTLISLEGKSSEVSARTAKSVTIASKLPQLTISSVCETQAKRSSVIEADTENNMSKTFDSSNNDNSIPQSFYDENGCTITGEETEHD